MDYIEAEHDPERVRRVSNALLRREQENYDAPQGLRRPDQQDFGATGSPQSNLAFGPAGTQATQSGAQATQSAPGGETAKPDTDQARKTALARQAYDFGYDTFLTMLDAANDAIKLLDKVDVPKTDTTKQLIGFAAAALLGGGAGAVAGWILGGITTAGLAGKAAGTASGLVSSAVKTALKAGDATAAASLADIKQAFNDTFKVQLDVARRDYIGRQDQLTAALTVFPVDQLQLLVDALKHQSTEELRARMRHETFVAWTNFLARAKHGEMRAWDYWTENGSPGALATSVAEQSPLPADSTTATSSQITTALC